MENLTIAAYSGPLVSDVKKSGHDMAIKFY
jgi:hypothetical protein